jgi:Putative DNA-binding domain
MPINVMELLESVMQGQELKPEQLDALMGDRVKEREHLEYKHGKVPEDKAAARAMVRQYVSGFANSDGGLLLIGIDEETMTVTGATAPGGGDLAVWASSCLVGIAGYFSPLPRFQVVEHRNGSVLVAATLRSVQLIPCPEGGRLIHYLRFHEKTLPAPDYLMADLVLGRRRYPLLEIIDASFTNMGPSREENQGQSVYYVLFGLNFRVENGSFLGADNAHMGLVFFDSWPGQQHRLNRTIESYVDVAPINEPRLIYNLLLEHEQMFASNELTRPFSTAYFQTSTDARIKLPLSVGDKWLKYDCKAAAYVVAKDGPPTWYQVTVRIDENLPRLLGGGPSGVADIYAQKHQWLDVRRVGGERPVVTWQALSP